MVALEKQSESLIRLDGLTTSLERIDFGPALTDLSADRDDLVRTVRHYLIPRLSEPEMPLNVVFAGPTGSGKSTLVNSLAGRDLSETGPVRPTTRGAIALTSPDVANDGVEVGGLDVETVVGRAPILKKLTLIDTPDIDSTQLEHRVMAEQLIDHADIVVFVTSALRYADEAPWQVLRRAVSRGSEVISVLNRVTSGTGGAIVDFKARLTKEGMGTSVLTVSEHHIDADQQRVPSLAVRTLSRRLVEVGLHRDDAGRSVMGRVHANVMDRAFSLAEEMDAVAGELDSFEAEMDISLASRVGRLPWPEEVGVVFPRSGSLWARRRWKKTSSEAVTDIDATQLVATIWSDMLRWPLEDVPTPLSTEEIRQAIDESLPVVESAVSGWRMGLPYIVETNHPAMWASAARRDLVDRIEVAYHHLVTRLIELAQIRFECSDPEDLRNALRAVTPVDA